MSASLQHGIALHIIILSVIAIVSVIIIIIITIIISRCSVVGAMDQPLCGYSQFGANSTT